jgi:hypothetical protein
MVIDGMKISVSSLVFELDNWSWGLVVYHLHSILKQEFNIQQIKYLEWKTNKTYDTDIILSQNVTQLAHIKHLTKTIGRLGGNMSFDNKSVVNSYLHSMSQCFAIIATNKKLTRIARTVNVNTHLIPNGLNLNEWKYINPTWKGYNCTVGFIGNIKSPAKRLYKGYDFVKQACDSMGLTLLEALYQDKQIPHDRMYEDFWSKIDIFVLPTQGEGCSNSIMEALTCGIPVITTNIAGYHGELLKHNENVLFCERNSVSIMEQLHTLLVNEALYYKLSFNGRTFAEKHHDINVVAEQYRKIFKSCYYNQEHEIG